MPVITLEIGRLTKEQKADLVRRFVEAAHDVTGVGKEHFVTIIRENDLDNIGSGEQLLSEKMKQAESSL